MKNYQVFVLFDTILCYFSSYLKELFLLVFGAKWLDAVPIFQILAFASIFKPISLFSLNILKVKNKPNEILNLQIISGFIGLILLLCSYSFGINFIAYSIVLTSLLTALLNTWRSGMQINSPMYFQLKDLIRIFISGFITLCACSLLKETFINLFGTELFLF